MKHIGSMVLAEPLNLSLPDLQIKKVNISIIFIGAEARYTGTHIQGDKEGDRRYLLNEGDKQADHREYRTHSE